MLPPVPTNDSNVRLRERRQRLDERAIDHLGEQARALPVERRPAAREERLEQAHRADGERDREGVLRLLEDGELGRAAADVDEQSRADRARPSRRTTASWMRRASSTPSMTSSSMPASRRARSTSVSPFFASRTALVAIGAVRVDLRLVHRATELAQRVARLADRRGRELAGQEHLGPEPDGGAQVRDLAPAFAALADRRQRQLRRVVALGRRRLDDAEPNGVRPEINRGESSSVARVRGTFGHLRHNIAMELSAVSYQLSASGGRRRVNA